jgi:hypothetical protein
VEESEAQQDNSLSPNLKLGTFMVQLKEVDLSNQQKLRSEALIEKKK